MALRASKISLLTPVDTLTSWYKRKGKEVEVEAIDEFKLEAKPSSLLEFANVFQLHKHWPCFVWLSGSCLSRPADCLKYIPSRFRRCQFALLLEGPGDFELELAIVAVTLPQALHCLDSILSLEDNFFTSLRFSGHPSHLFVVGEGEEVPPCPFEDHHLRAMLRVPNRATEFFLMSFSARQSRILAKHGADLSFAHCVFEDGGREFVKSFGERRQPRHLEKLRLHDRLPFDSENWLAFTKLLNSPARRLLVELKLSWISLTDEEEEEQQGATTTFHHHAESCRFLSTANISLLDLSDCVLQDKGAALVEAIRVGRGPAGLSATGAVSRRAYTYPFEKASMWSALMQAVASQKCNLKHLSVGPFPGEGGDSVSEELGKALIQNKSLEYFGIASSRTQISNCSWKTVLAGVAQHKNIRSLSLPRFLDSSTWRANSIDEAKLRGTRDVIEMLSTNQTIEEIHVRNAWYDRAEWDAHVKPRLECNRYRKLFPSIHSSSKSTRSGLLGVALIRFASKASLFSLLLSQNQDVVASCVKNNQTDTSGSMGMKISTHASRKRTRSESLP